MFRVFTRVAMAFTYLLAPAAALSSTAHPAVTVTGSIVSFYAGHVVLDAHGGARLDDGVLHVSADRIMVDLRTNRYLAAGNVTVAPAFGAGATVSGAAMSVDLTTHRGLFVSVAPTVSRTDIDGARVDLPFDAGSLPPDPLALPDVGGELPFAVAPRAVAHLGADVRLQRARVLVPGGREVGLPSYVYTFSSDQGYNVTNIADSGEDVPLVFGSTRNSIQGAHLAYDQLVKVSLGIDEHIVDGQRSYVIASVAPLNGPRHIGNFLWVDDVNAHTTQTYSAGVVNGFGVAHSYDLLDSAHRSYFDLSAQTFEGSGQRSTRLGWQGYDQQLSSTSLGSLLYFHLQRIRSATPATPFVSARFRRTWSCRAPYGMRPRLYTTTSAFAVAPGSSLTLSADYKSLHGRCRTRIRRRTAHRSVHLQQSAELKTSGARADQRRLSKSRRRSPARRLPDGIRQPTSRVVLFQRECVRAPSERDPRLCRDRQSERRRRGTVVARRRRPLPRLEIALARRQQVLLLRL
jgi:hypothetical protein